MKDENNIVISLNNDDFLPNWNEKSKDEKKTRRKPKKDTGKARIKKQVISDMVFKAYLNHKVTELLKEKFRSDGITRKVMSIADEIVNKNAYDLKIRYKEDKKGFWINKKTKEIYSDELIAIKSITDSKKGIIKIKIEKEFKIESKFEYILHCKKTDTLFPPTSYDSFSNLIDQHIFNENIQSKHEEYISSLDSINDNKTIVALSSKLFKKVKFEIDGKMFNMLQDAKDFILSNKLYKHFNYQNEIKSSYSKLQKEQQFESIKKRLNNYPKKYLVNDVKNNLILVLKKFNFVIFRKNNIDYITAYKNSSGKKELHGCAKEIYQVCDKSDITIKELLDLSIKLKKTKIEILQEIKLLIKDGLILQYENGIIELNAVYKN
jgi:hypothetical protein